MYGLECIVLGRIWAGTMMPLFAKLMPEPKNTEISQLYKKQSCGFVKWSSISATDRL
jgi:hypothetical protein